MKHIWTLFVSICIICTSCFLNQELPVEYDYSYKGRFDKYKSFAFIENNQESEQDHLIKNSVLNHMNFLGYKLKYNKPDLLISYAMFSDSLNLRGYDQMDIENWVEINYQKEPEYHSKNVAIQTGTLYLQIMDRRLNSSIWQGYVTQEYGSVDFSDSRNLRNAIRSVLNEYKFFADGFIEERTEVIN